MKAGPRKGQIRGKPRLRSSSEARAARATAASPGRTASTVSFPFACPAAAPPGAGSTRPTCSSPTWRSGLFTGRLPVHPHALGELRSQRMRVAGDLDHQGTAEWLPGAEQEPVAGLNLTFSQVAQHRRVAVGDAREDAALARLEIVQRHRVLHRDLEVAIRDRVAVRVPNGLPELGGDQLLELLADVVLEGFGLGVHLVPGHGEDL